jgi:tRNA-binding protein
MNLINTICLFALDRIFYNLASIGDVLIIILDEIKKPDEVVRVDDVASLYNKKELIGINIFDISKIIKIFVSGMIVFPSDEFIDVINHILINAHLNPLPHTTESGFRVGKVLTCEEHPDSDHLHVTTVDVGTEVLNIVCGAPNVSKDALVVVAMPNTMMFDGSLISPSSLRGIKSEGMLCSPKELHLPDAPQVRGLLLLDEHKYKVGDDFFLIGD